MISINSTSNENNKPNDFFKNLYVVLCVDVEPDRPSFGGKTYDFLGPQKWEGIAEGIPRFLNFRRNFQKEFDYFVNMTWFFRSDPQIKMFYKNAAWPVKTYKETVDSLLHDQNEVGWHAHTWRWNIEQGSWYQEIYDASWIKFCYESGFSAITDALNFQPTSFRAGWCFHDNTSMAVLNDLNIKVDLSAIPGFSNPGYKNTLDGSLFNGYVNWKRTTSIPYHPSKQDYQISGDPHYQLLELPMTTFRKPIVSYLHQILPFRVIGGFKLAKPEIRFSKYFLSPTSHPLLFERGVQSVVKRLDTSDPVFLVGAFHADEFLSKTLLANFRNNMCKLITLSKQKQISLQFITATEARNLIINNDI